MACQKCQQGLQNCGCGNNSFPPLPCLTVDSCVGSPCSQTWDSRCIIYNGSSIPAQNILTGDTLSTILQKILLYNINPSYVTNATFGVLTFGTLTGGTGYDSGGTHTYTLVPLTGGTGSGALATIIVTSGIVTSVTITTAGTGYTPGDILSTSNTNLGGTGSGFTILVGTVIGGCNSPLDLTIIGITTTTVSVSWTLVPNATLPYTLQYSLDNISWTTFSSGIIVNNAIITGLVTMTPYYIRVFNNCGTNYSLTTVVTTD